MARASGSYPAGRWFKSDFRYHLRPVGQAVKTRPFHGCNMGSIPVRVTKNNTIRTWMVLFFFLVTPYEESKPLETPAFRIWVRNIAPLLPCRKPCKAEQIPVVKHHPNLDGVIFSFGDFARGIEATRNACVSNMGSKHCSAASVSEALQSGANSRRKTPFELLRAHRVVRICFLYQYCF